MILRKEGAADPVEVPIVDDGSVPRDMTLESAHNYEDNSDIREEVVFEGAAKIVLTFDPRSATEANCDWFKLYSDEARENCLHELTGRANEGCWATKYEVVGDRVYTHFHSDSSNVDWGWKMTAREVIPTRTEQVDVVPCLWAQVVVEDDDEDDDHMHGNQITIDAAGGLQQDTGAGRPMAEDDDEHDEELESKHETKRGSRRRTSSVQRESAFGAATGAATAGLSGLMGASAGEGGSSTSLDPFYVHDEARFVTALEIIAAYSGDELFKGHMIGGDVLWGLLLRSAVLQDRPECYRAAERIISSLAVQAGLQFADDAFRTPGGFTRDPSNFSKVNLGRRTDGGYAIVGGERIMGGNRHTKRERTEMTFCVRIVKGDAFRIGFMPDSTESGVSFDSLSSGDEYSSMKSTFWDSKKLNLFDEDSPDFSFGFSISDQKRPDGDDAPVPKAGDTICFKAAFVPGAKDSTSIEWRVVSSAKDEQAADAMRRMRSQGASVSVGGRGRLGAMAAAAAFPSGGKLSLLPRKLRTREALKAVRAGVRLSAHGGNGEEKAEKEQIKWHRIKGDEITARYIAAHGARLFIACQSSAAAEFIVSPGDEPPTAENSRKEDNMDRWPAAFADHRGVRGDINFRTRGNVFGSPFLPLGLSMMQSNVGIFARLCDIALGEFKNDPALMSWVWQMFGHMTAEGVAPHAEGFGGCARVAEGSHPIDKDNDKVVRAMRFEGATSVVVEFDPKCLFDDGYALRFGQGVVVGARGKDELRDRVPMGIYEKSWCTTTPLEIPGNTVAYEFVETSSLANSMAWGYRFTARPVYSVRSTREAKQHVRDQVTSSMGMGTFTHMLDQLCSTFDYLKEGADGALEDAKSTKTSRDTALEAATAALERGEGIENGIASIVESLHNYADNTNEETAVSFPGASAIAIVFDPDSRTEQNYDFLRFRREAGSDEDPWIRDKFTGAKGGARNCPGEHGLVSFQTAKSGFGCDICSQRVDQHTAMYGCRQCNYDVCENCISGNWPTTPIYVEADSFVAHFYSDGSGNEWGYRFAAVPVYDGDAVDQGDSDTLGQLAMLVRTLESVARVERGKHELVPRVGRFIKMWRAANRGAKSSSAKMALQSALLSLIATIDTKEAQRCLALEGRLPLLLALAESDNITCKRHAARVMAMIAGTPLMVVACCDATFTHGYQASQDETFTADNDFSVRWPPVDADGGAAATAASLDAGAITHVRVVVAKSGFVAGDKLEIKSGTAGETKAGGDAGGGDNTTKYEAFNIGRGDPEMHSFASPSVVLSLQKKAGSASQSLVGGGGGHNHSNGDDEHRGFAVHVTAVRESLEEGAPMHTAFKMLLDLMDTKGDDADHDPEIRILVSQAIGELTIDNKADGKHSNELFDMVVSRNGVKILLDVAGSGMATKVRQAAQKALAGLAPDAGTFKHILDRLDAIVGGGGGGGDGENANAGVGELSVMTSEMNRWAAYTFFRLTNEAFNVFPYEQVVQDLRSERRHGEIDFRPAERVQFMLPTPYGAEANLDLNTITSGEHADRKGRPLQIGPVAQAIKKRLNRKHGETQTRETFTLPAEVNRFQWDLVPTRTAGAEAGGVKGGKKKDEDENSAEQKQEGGSEQQQGAIAGATGADGEGENGASGCVPLIVVPEVPVCSVKDFYEQCAGSVDPSPFFTWAFEPSDGAAGGGGAGSGNVRDAVEEHQAQVPNAKGHRIIFNLAECNLPKDCELLFRVTGQNDGELARRPALGQADPWAPIIVEGFNRFYFKLKSRDDSLMAPGHGFNFNVFPNFTPSAVAKAIEYETRTSEKSGDQNSAKHAKEDLQDLTNLGTEKYLSKLTGWVRSADERVRTWAALALEQWVRHGALRDILLVDPKVQETAEILETFQAMIRRNQSRLVRRCGMRCLTAFASTGNICRDFAPRDPSRWTWVVQSLVSEDRPTALAAAWSMWTLTNYNGASVNGQTPRAVFKLAKDAAKDVMRYVVGGKDPINAMANLFRATRQAAESLAGGAGRFVDTDKDSLGVGRTEKTILNHLLDTLVNICLLEKDTYRITSNAFFETHCRDSLSRIYAALCPNGDGSSAPWAETPLSKFAHLLCRLCGAKKPSLSMEQMFEVNLRGADRSQLPILQLDLDHRVRMAAEAGANEGKERCIACTVGATRHPYHSTDIDELALFGAAIENLAVYAADPQRCFPKSMDAEELLWFNVVTRTVEFGAKLMGTSTAGGRKSGGRRHSMKDWQTELVVKVVRALGSYMTVLNDVIQVEAALGLFHLAESNFGIQIGENKTVGSLAIETCIRALEADPQSWVVDLPESPRLKGKCYAMARKACEMLADPSIPRSSGKACLLKYLSRRMYVHGMDPVLGVQGLVYRSILGGRETGKDLMFTTNLEKAGEGEDPTRCDLLISTETSESLIWRTVEQIYKYEPVDHNVDFVNEMFRIWATMCAGVRRENLIYLKLVRRTLNYKWVMYILNWIDSQIGADGTKASGMTTERSRQLQELHPLVAEIMLHAYVDVLPQAVNARELSYVRYGATGSDPDKPWEKIGKPAPHKVALTVSSEVSLEELRVSDDEMDELQDWLKMYLSGSSSRGVGATRGGDGRGESKMDSSLSGITRDIQMGSERSASSRQGARLDFAIIALTVIKALLQNKEYDNPSELARLKEALLVTLKWSNNEGKEKVWNMESASGKGGKGRKKKHSSDDSRRQHHQVVALYKLIIEILTRILDSEMNLRMEETVRLWKLQETVSANRLEGGSGEEGEGGGGGGGGGGGATASALAGLLPEYNDTNSYDDPECFRYLDRQLPIGASKVLGVSGISDHASNDIEAIEAQVSKDYKKKRSRLAADRDRVHQELNTELLALMRHADVYYEALELLTKNNSQDLNFTKALGTLSIVPPGMDTQPPTSDIPSQVDPETGHYIIRAAELEPVVSQLENIANVYLADDDDAADDVEGAGGKACTSYTLNNVEQRPVVKKMDDLGEGRGGSIVTRGEHAFADAVMNSLLLTWDSVDIDDDNDEEAQVTINFTMARTKVDNFELDDIPFPGICQDDVERTWIRIIPPGVDGTGMVAVAPVESIGLYNSPSCSPSPNDRKYTWTPPRDDGAFMAAAKERMGGPDNDTLTQFVRGTLSFKKSFIASTEHYDVAVSYLQNKQDGISHWEKQGFGISFPYKILFNIAALAESNSVDNATKHIKQSLLRSDNFPKRILSLLIFARGVEPIGRAPEYKHDLEGYRVARSCFAALRKFAEHNAQNQMILGSMDFMTHFSQMVSFCFENDLGLDGVLGVIFSSPNVGSMDFSDRIVHALVRVIKDQILMDTNKDVIATGYIRALLTLLQTRNAGDGNGDGDDNGDGGDNGNGGNSNGNGRKNDRGRNRDGAETKDGNEDMANQMILDSQISFEAAAGVVQSAKRCPAAVVETYQEKMRTNRRRRLVASLLLIPDSQRGAEVSDFASDEGVGGDGDDDGFDAEAALLSSTSKDDDWAAALDSIRGVGNRWTKSGAMQLNGAHAHMLVLQILASCLEADSAGQHTVRNMFDVAMQVHGANNGHKDRNALFGVEWFLSNIKRMTDVGRTGKAAKSESWKVAVKPYVMLCYRLYLDRDQVPLPIFEAFYKSYAVEEKVEPRALETLENKYFTDLRLVHKLGDGDDDADEGVDDDDDDDGNMGGGEDGGELGPKVKSGQKIRYTIASVLGVSEQYSAFVVNLNDDVEGQLDKVQLSFMKGTDKSKAITELKWHAWQASNLPLTLGMCNPENGSPPISYSLANVVCRSDRSTECKMCRLSPAGRLPEGQSTPLYLPSRRFGPLLEQARAPQGVGGTSKDTVRMFVVFDGERNVGVFPGLGGALDAFLDLRENKAGGCPQIFELNGQCCVLDGFGVFDGKASSVVGMFSTKKSATSMCNKVQDDTGNYSSFHLDMEIPQFDANPLSVGDLLYAKASEPEMMTNARKPKSLRDAGGGFILRYFESPHQYVDNMDVRSTVSFPEVAEPVKRIAICFDPQCRTEQNYDYLQLVPTPPVEAEGGEDGKEGEIQTLACQAGGEGAAPHAMAISDFAEGNYSGGWRCDKCGKSGTGERWFCQPCTSDICLDCGHNPGTVPYYIKEKFSGPSSEENWPAKEIMFIEADRFDTVFRSDSSGTEWGYKFAARPIFTEAPKKDPAAQQVIDVARAAAGERAKAALSADSPAAGVRIVESSHQYSCNMSEETLIEFEGATAIAIIFDERCRSEHNYDFLRLRRNAGSDEKPWIQEKFSGSQGSENWPAEPVFVEASKFVAYFQSDGSNVEWGYRFACAPVMLPANSPPLYDPEEMKAEDALKLELLKTMASSGEKESLTGAMLVESPHPYNNNSDDEERVHFPGAVRISIFFDKQCRSEKGYDYLVLRKESGGGAEAGKEKEGNFWGPSEKYMGRPGSDADGVTWPFDAPVEIEGDTFFTYFKSDGSTNDWGYKMVCVAWYGDDAGDEARTSGLLGAMCPDNIRIMPDNPNLTSTFNLWELDADVQSLMDDPRRPINADLQSRIARAGVAARGDAGKCAKATGKHVGFCQKDWIDFSYESQHPYLDNMDEETFVSFPGATELTVMFDPKNRTESCDTLTFRKQAGSNDNSFGQRAGQGPSYWEESLKISGDRFWAFFHSDGSVNDWGYRFTVIPTFPEKAGEDDLIDLGGGGGGEITGETKSETKGESDGESDGESNGDDKAVDGDGKSNGTSDGATGEEEKKEETPAAPVVVDEMGWNVDGLVCPHCIMEVCPVEDMHAILQGLDGCTGFDVVRGVDRPGPALELDDAVDKNNAPVLGKDLNYGQPTLPVVHLLSRRKPTVVSHDAATLRGSLASVTGGFAANPHMVAMAAAKLKRGGGGNNNGTAGVVADDMATMGGAAEEKAEGGGGVPSEEGGGGKGGTTLEKGGKGGSGAGTGGQAAPEPDPLTTLTLFDPRAGKHSPEEKEFSSADGTKFASLSTFPIAEPVYMCDNSHPLEALGTNQDNGWSCSGMNILPGGCKKGCTGFRQSGGWDRWRCAHCDFDLCDECLESKRVPGDEKSETVEMARARLARIMGRSHDSDASELPPMICSARGLVRSEQNAKESDGGPLYQDTIDMCAVVIRKYRDSKAPLVASWSQKASGARLAAGRGKLDDETAILNREVRVFNHDLATVSAVAAQAWSVDFVETMRSKRAQTSRATVVAAAGHGQSAAEASGSETKSAGLDSSSSSSGGDSGGSGGSEGGEAEDEGVNSLDLAQLQHFGQFTVKMARAIREVAFATKVTNVAGDAAGDDGSGGKDADDPADSQDSSNDDDAYQGLLYDEVVIADQYYYKLLAVMERRSQQDKSFRLQQKNQSRVARDCGQAIAHSCRTCCSGGQRARAAKVAKQRIERENSEVDTFAMGRSSRNRGKSGRKRSSSGAGGNMALKPQRVTKGDIDHYTEELKTYLVATSLDSIEDRQDLVSARTFLYLISRLSNDRETTYKPQLRNDDQEIIFQDGGAQKSLRVQNDLWWSPHAKGTKEENKMDADDDDNDELKRALRMEQHGYDSDDDDCSAILHDRRTVMVNVAGKATGDGLGGIIMVHALLTHKNAEVVAAAVKLGVLLLDQADQDIRAEFLQELQKSTTFHVPAGAGINASPTRACKALHKIASRLDEFREIFPVLQGSRRIEAARRTKEMVRFIQLLCEGQYIQMKNFLASQPDPGIAEGTADGGSGAAAAVSVETKSGGGGGGGGGGEPGMGGRAAGGDPDTGGSGEGGAGVVVEEWAPVNIVSKCLRVLEAIESDMVTRRWWSVAGESSSDKSDTADTIESIELATQLCETLIELTQDCPGNQAAAVRDGIFGVLHRCMITAHDEETRLLAQFEPMFDKLWKKSTTSAPNRTMHRLEDNDRRYVMESKGHKESIMRFKRNIQELIFTLIDKTMMEPEELAEHLGSAEAFGDKNRETGMFKLCCDHFQANWLRARIGYEQLKRDSVNRHIERHYDAFYRSGDGGDGGDDADVGGGYAGSAQSASLHHIGDGSGGVGGGDGSEAHMQDKELKTDLAIKASHPSFLQYNMLYLMGHLDRLTNANNAEEFYDVEVVAREEALETAFSYLRTIGAIAEMNAAEVDPGKVWHVSWTEMWRSMENDATVQQYFGSIEVCESYYAAADKTDDKSKDILVTQRFVYPTAARKQYKMVANTLVKKEMDLILNEVERGDPAEKIDDFVERAQDLIAVVRYQHVLLEPLPKLRGRYCNSRKAERFFKRMIDFISSNERIAVLAMYLVTILINAILMAVGSRDSCRYDDAMWRRNNIAKLSPAYQEVCSAAPAGDQIQIHAVCHRGFPRVSCVDDHGHLFVSILSTVHVILACLVALNFVVGQAPVIIKKGQDDHAMPKKDQPVYAAIWLFFDTWLPDWCWSMLYLVMDKYLFYYMLFVGLSVLGNIFNAYFFAFHLVDIALRVKMIGYIIKAATGNLGQMGATLVMGFIFSWWFVIITFFELPKEMNYVKTNFTIHAANGTFYGPAAGGLVGCNLDAQTAVGCSFKWMCPIDPTTNATRDDCGDVGFGDGPVKCDTMLDCFLGFVDMGLRGPVAWENKEFSVNGGNPWIYFYDLMYNLIIILIMVAIITGIIIDTFADMRGQQEFIDEDMKGRCFICSHKKDVIDRFHDFKTHMKQEHNMWDYAFYIMYLEDKNKDELTGTELSVWRRFKENDIEWFPIQRAKCIPASDEDDTRLTLGNIESDLSEMRGDDFGQLSHKVEAIEKGMAELRELILSLRDEKSVAR
jgi:hypothetical protein